MLLLLLRQPLMLLLLPLLPTMIMIIKLGSCRMLGREERGTRAAVDPNYEG
jgi:hypothetical protein